MEVAILLLENMPYITLGLVGLCCIELKTAREILR